MKRKNKFLAILTFFLLGSSVAQIDTAFWFAAPWVTPDHANRRPIKLHISTFAAPSTTVRVRQPAAIAPNKYDTTFSIPANSNFDYTFWRDCNVSLTNRAYDSLETRPADVVVPYGLYISTTSNVSVVYDVITTGNNPETFSLKGQNGLGNEFFCPAQTTWSNQTKTDFAGTPPGVNQPIQQINIVASQANTIIWITPRCNVVGHPANITYSVVLNNPGDAYTVENMVQNTQVPGNNLSGTIVVSNKPVSVTVADDSVRTPGGGCHDLIGDQIVPVDIVGKNYIVNKGAMFVASLEGIYVVATQNFTSVKITDAIVTNTILNAGQTFYYNITQNLTFVEADKNVYLWQATGIGCEAGAAILPPLNCAGDSLVGFSRNTSQQFNLNILCKNGTQTTFTMNGNVGLIPASAFTVVPGTGGLYVGAQIPYSIVQVPIGSYTVGNNSNGNVFALGIFDGGPGTGGLFHYMSSFLRKTTVNTASISPVCAGITNTVALTGTISGAALTGTWGVGGGTISPTGGTISPNYSSTLGVVSTIYTLSPFEASTTTTLSITFSLTSIGCSPKTQTVSMIINPQPIVSVGGGTTMCKNNVTPVSLTGTVVNAVGGGAWSGGNGGSFGVPGPNTTYTPSLADLAANTITLTLTSSGPFQGCLNTANSITVSFSNPPVVNPGPSAVVCTNSQSFALNGSVSGFSNTGIWNTTGSGTFIPGSASPSATYILSVSDLTLSTIVFTLTSTNNGICSAVSNTMQVNIIAAPLVVAQADGTVCSSIGVLSLNGSVSGAATTGVWTTTNGSGAFTQVPPSNATYTLSVSETLNDTVLVFVLGSTGGICPSATDTLKISVVKPPTVMVNANNQTVCKNAPIQLTGTVSGFVNTGNWSATGTGTFTPNNQALGGQYFPSPGDVSAGSVTLILTANTPSCGASASFTAIFIESPTAVFNFPASGKCVGNSIAFSDGSLPNGSPSLSYNWNFGETPGSITTATNPIYTYTNTGSYVITLTVTGSNACMDTISRRVNIAPLPISSFSVTSACQGINSLFLDQSQSLAGGGYITSWTWQWGDAQPLTITGIPTTTVSHVYTLPNQYVAALTVSTNLGCTHSSTLGVNVTQKPDAEFGMTNNPTVAQEPVYFSDFSTPPTGIFSWYWQFGDEGSSTATSPTHNYQNAGIYIIKLTVVDVNGCSDTVSKSIEVNLLPQVPTAFTPNNDNNNDLLFVKGGPFEKMRFRVYDNWGELLFETTDQTIGWDGRKQGIDQPVGVYVWTLEVDMYNNRQVKKNGDVTLMR